MSVFIVCNLSMCISFKLFFCLRNQHVDVDLPTMERNLYRCKSLAMPSSPKTARELELLFQNTDTLRTYGFSQFEDGGTPLQFYRSTYVCDDFSYCIFASESVIRNIAANISVERRNYLMDATFKVCPMGEFTQFLIIHVEYMETVIMKFCLCRFRHYFTLN